MLECHPFQSSQCFCSFYKFLSKVLAGRLKKVIGKLVSVHQLAFIKGRRIIDASLIAKGCLDSRINQGQPGLFLFFKKNGNKLVLIHKRAVKS